MTEPDQLRRRTLASYPFHQQHQTRWSDNDQYSHVNNSVYYHLFDSIVNTYLIQRCGLVPNQIADSDGDAAGKKARSIGLVVESHCQFFSPLSFPQALVLGLRVTKLGRSSVTYEVGVFAANPAGKAVDGSPAAVGGYTHVFVDSVSRKSVQIPEDVRVGFEGLVVRRGKL